MGEDEGPPGRRVEELCVPAPEEETRSPEQDVLRDSVLRVLRGLTLTPLHTSSGGSQFNRTYCGKIMIVTSIIS